MRSLLILIASLSVSMTARAVVDPNKCELSVTKKQISAICDTSTMSKIVSYLLSISNQEQTGGANENPERIAAAKSIYSSDTCGNRMLNTILIDADHSYDQVKAAEGKALSEQLATQAAQICTSPESAMTTKSVSVELNQEASKEIGALLRKANLAGDVSVQFVGGPQVTTYSTGNLVCYFQNSDDSVSCSVSE